MAQKREKRPDDSATGGTAGGAPGAPAKKPARAAKKPAAAPAEPRAGATGPSAGAAPPSAGAAPPSAVADGAACAPGPSVTGGLSYAAAGVDIEAGEESVRRIKGLAES
ncbi:MAG: hypothetical protein ACYC5Q_15365, partial [Thermoleophilia bacterium]